MEKVLGHLTVDELQYATYTLIRLAQARYYLAEIRSLEQGNISRGSKLKSLSPFIDNNRLLGVGGRLSCSELNFNEKRPIILLNKHKITRLIILNEHYKQLHQGPQALLATIRLQYWPITGRRILRQVLSKCILCFRVRPKNFNVAMGNLPRERVVPSRPFTNCGIDFADPFEIKPNKLRGNKRIKVYLCAFVCFATKAVHLEIVSDLSTTSFLNCFKRFIGRRGLCSNIYTDNGTNFVGSRNELQNVYSFLRDSKTQSSFSDYFVDKGIRWHFIPPRSPHFGGIWEAVIKSAKYHIKRIVGLQVLTYEELETVVVQIESCLNSRPLTPLSENPDDLNTPGHFLIGTSLSSLPKTDLQDISITRVKRYEMLIKMVQRFWSKWSKDYLTQLQQRNKWF
ncbi:uncharacterized protein LOC115884017 [Sitophilus oryzae]|uniref:Uncharacterized protein LOC115884017 n=1 Tax=Sitophilus oryzae TaxID=7048 RepID=A0A6J2Y3D6_SITOR|nr:uncharacterized protein LOC115884017 [Sitophilus oryzae]